MQINKTPLYKIFFSNWVKIFSHYHIYLFGLALILVGLPTSMFLMSVGQIIIFANWLLERNFKNKFLQLRHNRLAILIISIFILHLFGLILTTDFNYAIKDLRMKLPFLILPLVIGTTSKLKSKIFNYLLMLFIGAVAFASFVSVFQLIKFKPDDIRNISIFISHIRFSLLISLSILILIYLIFIEKLFKKYRFVLFIPLLWLFIFLFIMESVTGIAVISAVSIMLYLIYFNKSKSTLIKIVSILILLIVVTVGSFWIHYLYKELNFVKKTDFKYLEKTTINGNPYRHDTTKRAAENGNLTWIYICDVELQKEWAKRSLYNYWGSDDKKQPLDCTLIRFLTSKGLRKDSLGVHSLSDDDILSIQQGVTSYKEREGSNINDRIQSVMWELQNYYETGNPNNHSASQRLEFWKAGMGIIKENWLFGVGIGDIYPAFDAQYRKMNSPLEMTQRLRTHNQYLSFFIVFGIFGFLWFLFVMFYPIYKQGRRNYYYLIFILIAAVSMIAEDTLETQAGVTFFVFFSSFFLLVRKDANDLQ